MLFSDWFDEYRDDLITMFRLAQHHLQEHPLFDPKKHTFRNFASFVYHSSSKERY
jgi:hypothetical protein